jgi:hypothetical protein
LRSKLRTRLTFANVGVVIAIFFAVGGPSFAASTVSRAARLITGKQIKDSSLTTKDVKNHSLLAVDFKGGQLPAGPQGPKGDSGPAGRDGPAGTFGAITVQHFTAASDLPDNSKASYSVFCPAGQSAIGGGARGDFDQSEGTVVTSSRPAISPSNEEAPDSNQTFSGWKIAVFNPSGGITTGIRPEVWAICAQH